jgi:tripartite-type tricarboxylate transporter receptor subunit TctC
MLVPGTVLAQTYPGKPVRVIVPFSPGGVTDIIARTHAAKLAELWGQGVVVENRPGAGGSLGAALVARAPADDYRKDFVDIAPLGSQPMVLVVSPASGIKTVSDLLALAR